MCSENHLTQSIQKWCNDLPENHDDQLILRSIFTSPGTFLGVPSRDIMVRFWFLCVMAYQTSCIIQCQSYGCRRSVVVQFNTELMLWGWLYPSQEYLSESEPNSMTGIRTFFQRYSSFTRQLQRQVQYSP